MDSSLPELLPALQRARLHRAPLVLGTLVAARGSTYRKAGAQIVIARDGACTGLLSGGCLEADLAEHATRVFASGEARLATYDNVGDEGAVLWGLGSGCVGGMDVLLTLLRPDTDWYPLSALADATESRTPTAWSAVTHSSEPSLPAGTFALYQQNRVIGLPAGVSDAARDWVHDELQAEYTVSMTAARERPIPAVRMFVTRLAFAPAIVVFGAGIDAIPVASFATALGWNVTLVDHRPAFLEAARRAEVRRVVDTRVAELGSQLDLDVYDAAVVMSHHVTTDVDALRLLSGSSIAYVGLLGPAARRRLLLDQLSDDQRRVLDARLHAPIGLDLGGRTPASIALSIVAELQAHFHGRSARSVDWSVPGER